MFLLRCLSEWRCAQMPRHHWNMASASHSVTQVWRRLQPTLLHRLHSVRPGMFLWLWVCLLSRWPRPAVGQMAPNCEGPGSLRSPNALAGISKKLEFWWLCQVPRIYPQTPATLRGCLVVYWGAQNQMGDHGHPRGFRRVYLVQAADEHRQFAETPRLWSTSKGPISVSPDAQRFLLADDSWCQGWPVH